MDENQNNFKQQTRDTINTAKEQMKNFNFKGEVEAGKGLFKELWSNPVNAIKDIVADKENKAFKTSILLFVVWLVLVVLDRIIYYASNEYIDFEFLPAFKVFLAPVLGIIAMVAALYLLNKKSPKSIVTLITAVVVTRIPLIISEILGLLYYISSNVTYVTSPITKILNVISIVLTFFAVKFIFNEEDNAKAFRLFVLVEGVYCLIYFVLKFLGIVIA